MISNPPPWPDGARCAVVVAWDLDADSSLNLKYPTRADTLVASQSMVQYGPRYAVPRLIEMGVRLGVPQTYYVPGWCIERYPEAVDAIASHGDEIALHGYLHERANDLSPDDERRWFERAVGAYERHLGRRPTGWRAPGFAFSKHSLRLLIDAHFDYDASLMGHDVPYLLRSGDDTLVELPSQWSLDDWPQYMHGADFGYSMPIAPPQRALEVFRSEFDAAWKHGGLWISVWHPFLSGRPARVEAIVELVEHMQHCGGVWFATAAQVAEHVRGLVEAGTWSPDEHVVPTYESPIPELVGAARGPAVGGRSG